MSDKKCNWWSNYATWKINSEIVSGGDWEFPVTYDFIEEYVEHIVFDHCGDMGLMESYARSFIAQVDFRELAEHINKDLQIQQQYEQ